MSVPVLGHSLCSGQMTVKRTVCATRLPIWVNVQNDPFHLTSIYAFAIVHHDYAVADQLASDGSVYEKNFQWQQRMLAGCKYRNPIKTVSEACSS